MAGTSASVGKEQGLQTEIGSGCSSSDDGWLLAVSLEAAALLVVQLNFAVFWKP